MRAGDFSAIPRALRNPFTGEPFPNNQIPTSLFSPAAVKIVNEWLPLPNPVGTDNPLTLRFAQPSDDDDHQWLGRADHTFTDKHRMYGRFWVSRASTPAVLLDGNILSSAFGRTWQNTVASINDTYILRPNLLNNLVVTFNRTNNLNFQIYPPDYSTLGINVYNDETPQWFFNVAGYFGINSGDTNTFLRNEIQFVDTVRWTKGRHEVATGIDYSYGQGDTVNNFRANGRFSVLERGGVHRRRAGGFLPREVLELRAGDRRIQEHADALPGDVRPGHVPGEPPAHAESRACGGIRSSPTRT